jgi:hypothetical protein
MKLRAILARMKAKQHKPVVAVHHHREGLGKIAMKDPTTNEVTKEFESIEQAVGEGFSMPQIVKAISHGNKYKGSLWTSENEMS